jgi:SnoaL-like domain
MSQENVEAVRRDYEAVTARLESLRELFAPDYALDVGEVSPEFVGAIRGFEAAEEALREYWVTFENFRVELEEVIHAEEEPVRPFATAGGREGATSKCGTVSSTSGPSEMARSFASRYIPTGIEPSRPPGCGSRRCRRRTWNSRASASRPSWRQ